MTDAEVITLKPKKVFDDMPQWIPRNELLLKSYIIRHPSCIGSNLEFIGYEIFHSDLLFRRGSEYVVVEAKYSSEEHVLEKAIPQVHGYTQRISMFEKNVVPLIVGLDTQHSPKANRLTKKLSTMRDFQESLNYMKKLLSDMQTKYLATKNELEKAKETLREINSDIERLNREKSVVSKEATRQFLREDPEFGEHLQEQIAVHKLNFGRN